jgi:hypothetical protein
VYRLVPVEHLGPTNLDVDGDKGSLERFGGEISIGWEIRSAIYDILGGRYPLLLILGCGFVLS